MLLAARVALRKESVDRNITIITTCIASKRSLSARRAWIEMDGVVSGAADYVESLSARRAWIEILTRDADGAYLVKSLSARRAWIEIWSRI